MRIGMFVLFLLLSAVAHASDIPKHAEAVLEKSGLTVSRKLKPVYLIQDFNGDGKPDLVFYVVGKSNGKHGLCILHAGSERCIVLGAGKTFASGGDDFNWVDKWKLIPAGPSWETTFQPNGDVLGTRKVTLTNRSFEICVDEGGCGVITYRKGRYRWVHQAD